MGNCPDCFLPLSIGGIMCANLCRLKRENFQRIALTSNENMLQRMAESQTRQMMSSGDRYISDVESWIAMAANGQIDYEKLLLEDMELWDDSKTNNK